MLAAMRSTRALLLSLAAAICCARGAGAQQAAVVEMSLGTAVVARVASGARLPITNGLALNVGDVIQTANGGYVHALFGDGTLLAVRPNSLVRIAGFSAKGDASDALWLELTAGAFRCVTGWISKARPGAVRGTTNTAVLGVRGTDFELVRIAEGQAAPGETAGTHALLHEGFAALETQAGRVELQPGEAAFASRAQEPPRLHLGVPAFISTRAAKTDELVEEHARHIEEHMAKSLKERGLLRQGETVQQQLERRREEGRVEQREERPHRPERLERPARPERPERQGRH
jgi:hypothetical protein